MNDDRFILAKRLGESALFRLRAEVLLEYGDDGTIPLTEEERTTLERIAVVPRPEDREFLNGFDRYYEAWEEDK